MAGDPSIDERLRKIESCVIVIRNLMILLVVLCVGVLFGPGKLILFLGRSIYIVGLVGICIYGILKLLDGLMQSKTKQQEDELEMTLMNEIESSCTKGEDVAK